MKNKLTVTEIDRALCDGKILKVCQGIYVLFKLDHDGMLWVKPYSNVVVLDAEWTNEDAAPRLVYCLLKELDFEIYDETRG